MLGRDKTPLFSRLRKRHPLGVFTGLETLPSKTFHSRVISITSKGWRQITPKYADATETQIHRCDSAFHFISGIIKRGLNDYNLVAMFQASAEIRPSNLFDHRFQNFFPREQDITTSQWLIMSVILHNVSHDYFISFFLDREARQLSSVKILGMSC